MHEGKTYVLVNAIGSAKFPTANISTIRRRARSKFNGSKGSAARKAAAPQARLMATVISGILNRRLPWRLVFLGVFLVIAIEILGVRSLPFAVGSYISIGTTMAMFAGGLVRWLAERGAEKKEGAESEVSPGSLYSSGLIAAGGVFGLLAIVINLLQDQELSKHLPHWLVRTLHLPWPTGMFTHSGRRSCRISSQAQMGLGVFLFVVLAVTLFVSARKKLKQS